MFLETKRLTLREMVPDDLEDLFKIFSDPETMRFHPQPFDRTMTQVWIERSQQRYARDGLGLWALLLKNSGELIGDCGLLWQEVDGVEELEIGYHVRRDWWGQGLGTESARACRDYGFQHCLCNRLISLIHPDNWASRRVAEKNGMQLTRQTEWRGRLTCIYAIERGHF